METKPGPKTSEFWVTIAAMILPIIMPGVVTAETATVTAGTLAGIYTLARAWVKARKP